MDTPLLYYIVSLVGGLGLLAVSGRLVVDPASYGIPNLPVILPSILALIVYELLVLPWLFKTKMSYGAIRAPIILLLILTLIYGAKLQPLLLILGATILFIETKILLDIAATKRQVLYSLAGIFRGLTGFMAIVYSISIIQPTLENSIITITQLILALLPFIILGAYMGITIHLLTMTRDPLKLGAILAPLTLLTVLLTIITYIYTQPALTNPDIALETYGNMTRAISLLAPITITVQTLLERKI